MRKYRDSNANDSHHYTIIVYMIVLHLLCCVLLLRHYFHHNPITNPLAGPLCRLSLHGAPFFEDNLDTIRPVEVGMAFHQVLVQHKRAAQRRPCVLLWY